LIKPLCFLFVFLFLADIDNIGFLLSLIEGFLKFLTFPEVDDNVALPGELLSSLDVVDLNIRSQPSTQILHAAYVGLAIAMNLESVAQARPHLLKHTQCNLFDLCRADSFDDEDAHTLHVFSAICLCSALCFFSSRLNSLDETEL